MKKRLVVVLMSLAALALNNPAAHAWLFHHKCCGCKCCTTICCRPYNAFSPCCCGTLCCTGCCPMMGGPSCGPTMPSCFSCGPQSCCSSGCCDSGSLPAPGAVASIPPAAPATTPTIAPANPLPSGPSVPSFTAPNPTPLAPTSQYWQGVMPYGYGSVQTAAYRPNYYGYAPTYNPGYYPGYYPGTVPGYYPTAGYYPTQPSYNFTPPAYW